MSFPPATEMFQFAGFASPALCIQLTAMTPEGPGFPIRRSSDQSLLAAPRRLFAACHVLHRLLTPRHSPNALLSLEPPPCTGNKNNPPSHRRSKRPLNTEVTMARCVNEDLNNVDRSDFAGSTVLQLVRHAQRHRSTELSRN